MLFKKEIIKVFLSSANPIKITATKDAFKAVFPKHKIEVISKILEDNGISTSQPLSAAETCDCALKRARNLHDNYVDKTFNSYSVGLEGGVDKSSHGFFLCEFAALVDETGKVGIGGGNYLLLPDLVAESIEKEELGTIMDKLFDKKNSKQIMGCEGLLTKGLINRRQTFTRNIVLALVPFVNQTLYKK